MNYTDQQASDTGKKTIPAGIFQPRLKDMIVKELYDEFAKDEHPSWPTFSSGTEVQLSVDAIMLISCAAREDWSSLKGAWMSSLLDLGTVFSPEDSEGWFCSVGTLEKVMVCGWPMVETKINGRKFFVLRQNLKLKDLYLGSVLDESRWSCFKSEWVSPLHVELSRPVATRKGATAFSKAPHLVCSTEGRPMSLLQHCAWHCFFDLSLPPLREIARLHGVSGWKPRPSTPIA